jgi:thioredoxin reductase (NADPH)
MRTDHDLVIIGGGIAGMTAAIFAARANIPTVVLEEEVCGGLANWTHTVENFPSHSTISGMELSQKVRNHVETAGADIVEIAQVTDLDLLSTQKTLKTDEGDFQCRAVIIATGSKPIPFPLETEWQDHIHYCSVCDGNLYKGKNVLVLGGGNSAFDESLYLLDLGVKSITIVEALPKCTAAEGTVQKAIETGNVEILTDSKIQKLVPKGKTSIVMVQNNNNKNEKIFEIDGIFVFIGQTPSTKFLNGQVQLDEFGYILTNQDMHTNLAGVFAAGDVVKKRYRQLTTAMADGTIAALEAKKYLNIFK